MRIAMFSDNFYPELSGISDSIIDTAKELAKSGHQIDFYVPRYSKNDFHKFNVPHQELNLGENISIRRIFSLQYPSPTQQARMVIPTFLKSLALRKKRPDVIHTHLFFGVGMEGMIASKILGIPLVGTSHTPLSEFMRYSLWGRNLFQKSCLKFVSWYYNQCDFVTAPSGGILKEMEIYNFRRPSKVVSNPIDPDKFYPSSSEKKSQLKKSFKLSDFTVIYTGRLAEEKHVDVILKAVALAKKRIPSVTLAITGHGAAEESLKILVKELGISGNVRFFGTLSIDDHADIYRAADVFAIASTAETQSLSLIKAMATGLPVIGVNARALPEYINPKNGFLVETGDFESMAKKIVLLYKDEELRESLGKGGLEYVRQFSLDNISKQWDSIYREIITAFNNLKSDESRKI